MHYQIDRTPMAVKKDSRFKVEKQEFFHVQEEQKL